MLELMQQEVLELGDGASTDSGWGESSSSSGERKSSSRGDGTDERSGGSGDDVGEGTRSRRGSGGNASCVSTPELAVFLFQGGVDSGSRSGIGSGGGGEMEGDEGLAAGPRGEREDPAEPPSPIDPSTADDKTFSDLEYSRTGPRGRPRQAREDAASGMLDSAAAAAAAAEDGGAATCNERGRAAMETNPSDSGRCRRQEPVVVVANDTCGKEEKEDQEPGTLSSSLTGGLRGVHFVLN
ncbi:unnamed protein product [Scytosiphon promiscuus]